MAKGWKSVSVRNGLFERIEVLRERLERAVVEGRTTTVALSDRTGGMTLECVIDRAVFELEDKLRRGARKDRPKPFRSSWSR